MPQSSEKYNEKLESNETNRKFRLVRGIWYFLGLVLLFLVTVLIFFALFSNNWQRTIPELSTNNDKYTEYYSFGVWFTCRHVNVKWLGSVDSFCSQVNRDLGSWIVAVQVFYTLGAFLNLIALSVSLYGMCKDISNHINAIPSLVLWMLVVASIFQLIAISVYGSLGIGNYTNFQPDYSIICSSVALGFNAVCIGFFLVEIINTNNNSILK